MAHPAPMRLDGASPLGLPGSVTSIDGIQLRATLKLNNNGGTSNICAQLS